MTARIQVAPARRGQATAVRVLVQHPMETGYRFDLDGTPIAKNVIHSLQADYLGLTVFRARLGSGMAANPFLQFWFVPEQSGELYIHWQDDQGVKGTISARIELAD